MTISFSIDGIEEEHGYDLPCPDCGLTLSDAHLDDDRNFDCSCYGYGGPEKLPEPQFYLNVSTENGVALLRHLGLPAEEFGQVDPQDLLTALAIKEGQDDLLMCSGEFRGRNFLGGRTASQVERYRSKLTKIATKASDYGRDVVWQ